GWAHAAAGNSVSTSASPIWVLVLTLLPPSSQGVFDSPIPNQIMPSWFFAIQILHRMWATLIVRGDCSILFFVGPVADTDLDSRYAPGVRHRSVAMFVTVEEVLRQGAELSS